MNPTLHNELRDSLTEFLSVTADTQLPPDERRARLTAALNRLLDLEKQLPPDADPNLKHYLARRSYTKAMEFLSTGAKPKC
jgi:hypothetical protein